MAVAVNVTDCPLQIEVADGDTLTVGATVPVTVTVTALEVAVVGAAQLAFDVNTQLTTSLLFNEDVLYVLLFVPAFEPFTFH